MSITEVATAAERLLDQYDFGKNPALAPKPSKADTTLANTYAAVLDNYNNGMYCGGTTE